MFEERRLTSEQATSHRAPRWIKVDEVGDEWGMIGRALGAAFDVVDPSGVEAGCRDRIGGDEVDAHSEISGVTEAVVPPREPSLMLPPFHGVDVDQAGFHQCLPRGSFGRCDVRASGEGVGMEHVAVGRCDVDVATDDRATILQPSPSTVGVCDAYRVGTCSS